MTKAWRLTERDLEWLRFVGRFPFATPPTIQRELARLHGEANMRSVWRRVQAAREMGLVETKRFVADKPAAVWLTREGMNAAGVPGEVSTPRLGQFHHDLHVLDLAQWLVVERPQHTLVTEREMRREDTPNSAEADEPKWAVHRRTVDGHRSGGATRVYPDLVTVRADGKHLIHEVEVSPKEVRRLVRLMLSYLHSDVVAGVRYYCLPAAEERVKRAAEAAKARAAELGLAPHIYVVPWDETQIQGGGKTE